MALSDTKLRSINNKPYAGPPEVADADGLSVRVTPKGIITFQYRYRWHGKPQRLGLGRYPSLPLRDARNLCHELRLLYDSGVDPRTHFQKPDGDKKVTISDCIDYWHSHYVKTELRAGTQRLYRHSVIKRMSGAFPGCDVSEITVRQWMDFFTDLEKDNPAQARVVLALSRSAINWCIRRHLIDDCAINKLSPKDIGRKYNVGNKVLTYRELALIWLAIERSDSATSNKLLHQLVMLWGCRISELRLSVKGEFDLIEDVWTVPSEHSKMGNIIRRPIFTQIKPYLNKAMTDKSDLLFPGRDGGKPINLTTCVGFVDRLRDELDIGYWRGHDFRRTLVTRLSEEGIAPHVTEKMLGHELGGVMAIYNKHDWIKEQHDAYELHADKIFWHVKKLSG